MGVPISQMWTVASYVVGQKLKRRKHLSRGVDAGAADALQPRVRGLREDSVSRAHLEEGTHAGRVLPRGG